MADEYRYVGKSTPRPDASTRVTGKAIYGDDVRLPGMLYGMVLRSPYGHARIVKIDTSKAEKLPGVKAVVTAKDAPDVLYGTNVKDMRLFAKERVRYQGEGVAAVAAVNLETAEEALQLIEVEYEELPLVIDPEKGAQPDAPLLHEEWQGYASPPNTKRWGNVCTYTEVKVGDVEKGFAESDYIFEDRFETPMVHQTYLEPKSAMAAVDASGKLTVWTTTQGQFSVRASLAEILQMPLSQIRVIPTEIGGGFGGKLAAIVEPVCALLALKTGRPVKITMSRDEDFVASTPRHPCIIEVKTGVKKDGTLVARQAKIYLGTGGYATSGTYITPGMTPRLSGPYKIPHVYFEGFAVYTNQPPCGAYRAPGSPQATFAFESQMDIIAKKLGIDPIELRRKNALQKSDQTPIGSLAESASLQEMLDTLLEEIHWYTKPLGKNQGRGIACSFWASGGFPGSGCIKLNEDGTIGVLTGAVDLTGSNMILAQIAAEELGVTLEKVSVITGDTDGAPVAPVSAGSNITRSMGMSVKKAAEDIRNKIFEAAAESLEANREDLELQDGRVFVKGSPERSLSLREIYGIGVRSKGGPMISTASTGVLPATVNFVLEAAEVEVDPETGEVELLDLVAVEDVGFAINPMSVEGQIEGGVVQGVGYALMEEMVFKDGKVINPHLLDYKIPCSLDVPKVRTVLIEERASNSPYGAKGVGEPPIVPTAAAIANAIANAIGARVKELPITPDRILKALKEKA
ncbi:MAG: xanthine dehydrogenase family protein molybdopterin-binding subunit [Candidatus Tectomicrobia bacterium]|nr:xanthine dehydrogenase family protein molybdopterin-binding subunit [Candidatus Tectomicrobia bacterium]